MIEEEPIYPYSSYTPCDALPDGSEKLCIWHSPKHSLPVLRQICKEQGFKIYEEAILWLIQSYELRPFTWGFNHCNQPKFWFRQKVNFPSQNRKGTVFGIEWRDEEHLGHRAGFWYRVRWEGKISLQSVHQDSLEAVEGES